MRRMLDRHLPVGVIQMCWIAPGPAMLQSVKVFPGSIRTLGEIFQPTPSSRAAFLPVPSVAMPALPFSPVKFSGLIDRDLALLSLASDSMLEKSDMKDRRSGAGRLRQMPRSESFSAQHSRRGDGGDCDKRGPRRWRQGNSVVSAGGILNQSRGDGKLGIVSSVDA